LYNRKSKENVSSKQDIEKYLLLDESQSNSMYWFRSKELLFSSKARGIWIEPDIQDFNFY